MGTVGANYTIGNLLKTFKQTAHGGSPNWAAGSLGVRLTNKENVEH